MRSFNARRLIRAAVLVVVTVAALFLASGPCQAQLEAGDAAFEVVAAIFGIDSAKAAELTHWSELMQRHPDFYLPDGAEAHDRVWGYLAEGKYDRYLKAAADPDSALREIFEQESLRIQREKLSFRPSVLGSHLAETTMAEEVESRLLDPREHSELESIAKSPDKTRREEWVRQKKSEWVDKSSPPPDEVALARVELEEFMSPMDDQERRLLKYLFDGETEDHIIAAESGHEGSAIGDTPDDTQDKIAIMKRFFQMREHVGRFFRERFSELDRASLLEALQEISARQPTSDVYDQARSKFMTR